MIEVSLAGKRYGRLCGVAFIDEQKVDFIKERTGRKNRARRNNCLSADIGECDKA